MGYFFSYNIHDEERKEIFLFCLQASSAQVTVCLLCLGGVGQAKGIVGRILHYRSGGVLQGSILVLSAIGTTVGDVREFPLLVTLSLY